MNRVAWHENCVLRDDVRQGRLALAEFAADLDAVRKGSAPNVYRMPDLFFSRTYPTDNLKTLVRDVLHRLSGRGGKPVIRVQVAYGGGKTHALIALLHLAEGGAELETYSTVGEFMQFSELNQLPQARVALLPFDNFDVIEGLSVVGPDGTRQQVKTPWGALAYQLAGAEGLERVAAHEADYVTPAQSILVDLLKPSEASGPSTLILIDEVLTYMRRAVNAAPERLGILQDFFRMLTQAVGEVDRASLVASLISKDVVLADPVGVQCLNALEDVFHRVEETNEPVSREDISELLRRRLFESVVPQDTRRSIVDCFSEAMQQLPLRPSQRDHSAYNRLLDSYPFHPDLLEVFYQKWTGLSKFQRTRGVLRTFAIALKDSAEIDPSAFVGPGALLGNNDKLSEATRELIETCDEGNVWTPILRGELEKARDIQDDYPLLKGREIEWAVISTFLHSQPLGQKADSTNLYALLAHQDVDKISVEEGLAKWRERSWFLKEDGSSWCLGTAPNLTNMHVRAIGRLNPDQINDDLVKQTRAARLSQNVDADDVRPHLLPDSPADIADTPDLHFVVARPEYTAVPGEEVPVSLKAFFDRTYRNHIIILAPDNSRLSGLAYQIRKIRAWQDIEGSEEVNLLSALLKAELLQRKQGDEHGIADSVKSAYSVVIAVDEDGDIEARQLLPGTEPPFERVKAFLADEERLLTTSLDPDLLKPGSYLELWGADDTSKPVHQLYGMFASLPRLPRLLNREVFLDTLRRGVVEGRIVLCAMRPDGSQHTYWRETPSNEDLEKKDLEIVPVENAALHNLNPELLCPGRLPELWRSEDLPIRVTAIREFFDGNDVPKLASDAILFGAVKSAIQVGLVMARSQNKAYFSETIPDAELNDNLELLPPPQPIRASELTKHTLPEAWEGNTSTLGQVMRALIQHRGAPIAWPLIVRAVNDGVSLNLFKTTEDSPAPPWTDDKADRIGLRVSETPMRLAPHEIVVVMQDPPDNSGYVTLKWIKEKLESKKGVPIPDDVFHDAVDQALDNKLIIADGAPVDDFYQMPVRLPDWIGHAESSLTETQIQDFAEKIGNLSEIAPELEFEFQLSITAEGQRPPNEVLEQLNEVLGEVRDALRFGSDGS